MTIKEKPLCCEDCKYYIQHYRKQNEKFVKVFCGHCINLTKNRKFRSTKRICEEFKNKNS